MFNQPGSRRWTHFHSALQLAIQRSAHKWTFEDFAECFPLYVEEDKNGASATFNSISEYIEAQNFRDLDKTFKDYRVQENIDILHKIFNEAKDRKAKGNIGKDAWREDLEPEGVAAARTVPVLQSEATRLREELAAIEEENARLQAQIKAKVKAAEDADQRAMQLLDDIDGVYEEWKKLPVDEMEAWTLQTTESLKPSLPS